ncbi:transcription antitermination factor NusB [Propioniciclava soli]|uniref:Transcription antitermination protein NusB n=1 Tax=Propioniciclava soli TaxID=2775081 RepID=A0ABZ3C426_9ACTN
MTKNRQNTTRGKARKHALDILYEADVRGADPREMLADRIALGERTVRPFTIEIVQGVTDHGEALDATLRDALAEGWSVERMPSVDRCLARIGLFELAHTDTPAAIVVNEAVDLAAEYSTPTSPGFLNALLARVARDREGAEATPAVADAPAADDDAPAAEAGTPPVAAQGAGDAPAP